MARMRGEVGKEEGRKRGKWVRTRGGEGEEERGNE